MDLRAPLRDGADDAELARLIGARWANRADRYSEQRAELRTQTRDRVEMFAIGG